MMEEYRNSEIKTLEKLSLEGCRVLFDISVIKSPFRKSEENYKLPEEKNGFIEKNNRFLAEVREYINRGNNFYTTKRIARELDKLSHYHPKNRIKGKKGTKFQGLTIYSRLKKAEVAYMKELSDSFRDNKKIIILDEDEGKLYHELSEKYDWIEENYKLRKTGFDLLLKGVVLAKMSDSVVLLSNDYSIFNLRNKLLLEDHSLIEKNIRFFNRKGFFKFKKFKNVKFFIR